MHGKMMTRDAWRRHSWYCDDVGRYVSIKTVHSTQRRRERVRWMKDWQA